TELLESHRVAATPENLQLLCERYYELLPQELERSAGRILPGVCEVLVALQERGACYLGLLSGNMRRSARIKLEHFGLWEYFDFGVFGDEARERPLLSVPALTAVAKRSGQQLPAERMVIIGDTPLDIALAQAMGVRCLAVCTGGFDEASLLAAGACRVVADLAQTKNICEWFFLQMELDR
ncbi:MAG: HAD hydrolase-like protein, partial [Planctomycetales bacterium]|nr:HAD hydrolase-like protein [Planctomycetales bacterium]